jgi:hypothetical protein
VLLRCLERSSLNVGLTGVVCNNSDTMFTGKLLEFDDVGSFEHKGRIRGARIDGWTVHESLAQCEMEMSGVEQDYF